VNDITVERNRDGSYTATTLVEDDAKTFPWYEHHRFFGYDEDEIEDLFLAHLKYEGMRIVEES
jgi:hypothetical protein